MQRHIKAVEPTAPTAEAMWNMDPQSFEAVTNTYRVWINQANRMRDETTRFVQERFTKELEAAVQLARCTNSTERLPCRRNSPTRWPQITSQKARKLSSLWAKWRKRFPRVPKPTEPITHRAQAPPRRS